MTPERFQQIEELYHAARERTGEERAALLAQTDPELRREVESLLVSAPAANSWIGPPIENAPRNCSEDSTLTESAVGANLGPYRFEASSARAAWAKSFGPSTRD